MNGYIDAFERRVQAWFTNIEAPNLAGNMKKVAILRTKEHFLTKSKF